MPNDDNHPLVKLLADFINTPQGRSMAEDLLSVKGAADYASAAPDRLMDDLEDPPGLSTENAIQSAGDLALMLMGGGGFVSAGKGAGSFATKRLSGELGKWTRKARPQPEPPTFPARPRGPYVEPQGFVGPRLAPDAKNYTGKHTEIARDVMRKQLSDPSRNMNSQTLAKEVGDEFAKRAPNVPPNVDDLAQSTMRRLPEDLDLTNPAEVERAIQMATGWRKGGKATTLGLAGATAGGAMSDPEIEALLAEIMGGGR